MPERVTPTPQPDWCPENPDVFCAPNAALNAMDFALQARGNQCHFSDVPENIKPLFDHDTKGFYVSLMGGEIPESDWDQWNEFRDFIEGPAKTACTIPIRAHFEASVIINQYPENNAVVPKNDSNFLDTNLVALLPGALILIAGAKPTINWVKGAILKLSQRSENANEFKTEVVSDKENSQQDTTASSEVEEDKEPMGWIESVTKATVVAEISDKVLKEIKEETSNSARINKKIQKSHLLNTVKSTKSGLPKMDTSRLEYLKRLHPEAGLRRPTKENV